MRITNVCIISLGCPKNRVDSEVMAGLLAERGRKIVGETEQADAIIVNTCSFIKDAKEESIDTVLESAEICGKTGASLVVTGCLPQRYRTDVSSLFPEVNCFLGTGNFQNINKILDELENGTCRAKARIGALPHFLQHRNTPRMNSSPFYTAYLKIAEGCSNKCSFCAIPSIRGPQESRKISDLVTEAGRLAETGVKELNLIAQDLTAYGSDLRQRPSLAGLLKELCGVGGIEWIRLLYCYPRTFSKELMRVIASEKKICKYVDIPIQHNDPVLLKSMKRGRGPDYVTKLLNTMRSEIPGLVLRTTFIVGYPGETDEMFESLCGFIEEMKFDNAGFFGFSPEEGTPAATLPGQVPETIISRRVRNIHKLQRVISKKLNRRLVGKQLEVLVHGPSQASEHLLEGRHRGQAPEIDGVVFINEGTAKPGDIVTCEITQSADYDLVGKIMESL